jgi:hypothetical protein
MIITIVKRLSTGKNRHRTIPELHPHRMHPRLLTLICGMSGVFA